MSTLSRSAPSVKVDPGPELRSVGRRLHYPFCNLAAAAEHHARHGTVEGSEVVDPADAQRGRYTFRFDELGAGRMIRE
jgi:hypothetical protein